MELANKAIKAFYIGLFIACLVTLVMIPFADNGSIPRELVDKIVQAENVVLIATTIAKVVWLLMNKRSQKD